MISMQWNSPLVRNGMLQGTINSSRSTIGIWISCLHDWLLLANAINYSRLSQLIALRNLTNPTPQANMSSPRNEVWVYFVLHFFGGWGVILVNFLGGNFVNYGGHYLRINRLNVIYWLSTELSIKRCTCVNKRKNSGSRWALDNNITRCPDGSSQL